MRRLPVVAIGVALCAFATSADARSSRMHLGSYDGHRSYSDGDWDEVRPQPRRRSARSGKRRHAASVRSQRRRAARGWRRGRTARRASLRARGLGTLVRGGVSRRCLTPAARGLLNRIEAQFGHVRLVSTCRPGAVIAGSGRPSRHASGNAIDFNAPAGRKGEVVRWLIANHRRGGVMTYRDMNHIHVDIGRHFVALAANSRGGNRWRSAGRR